MKLCEKCGERRPALRRPKDRSAVCKRGTKLAIGASGGKDSTVLAHVLTLLNERHDYGLEIVLLSIDEGISGYRDDSLEFYIYNIDVMSITVKRNGVQYKAPLRVFSYKDLYGWTMDEIVKEIGLKNNCNDLSDSKRYRGADLLKVDMIATGHNADDIAETVILNLLRGDVPRLGRCTSTITGEGEDLPRCKPFKFTYEKEIVMYAHFKNLDYFSTECIYSPNAYRGHAREYIKQLEAIDPRTILNIIKSAEDLAVRKKVERKQVKQRCERCGYISSQKLCKACVLLEGLATGQAREAAMGKARKPPSQEQQEQIHPRRRHIKIAYEQD